MQQVIIKPLISVVVPVFNVEQYLEKCIESILHQTYPNIEIIMVDDGSTDNSGRICDEYCNQYDNCHVIHKNNEGLGMARNTGLEHIRGEYVTFCDSDDWLDPELVEKLYESIETNKTEFCKSGFRHVQNSGKIEVETKYRDQIYKDARVNLLPHLIGSSPETHDSIEPSVCANLYYVKPIKVYSLQFPSERSMISEDLVFNIDYFQHIFSASVISYIGYNYRANESSLTHSYRDDRFEKSVFLHDVLKQKLLDLGYNQEVIYRLDKLFFIHLRRCVSQLKKQISRENYQHQYRELSKICKNKMMIDVINNYPVNKLEIKQRMFLILMKKGHINTLLFLTNLKII